ncbi:hypothetical protein PN462_15710 [Spirulina sp. CS-785/01]|uniref:hypothetical protein n=1 Tax=Spirulina sp. CS-785/01 TaxID=3021716 RepID=UPI00232F900C|nr:hypothetical protein [Spirulina sp. CS-785/01]MDB9314557.1 hypothetical protein [Spirulina sp. CS-785/01]
MQKHLTSLFSALSLLTLNAVAYTPSTHAQSITPAPDGTGTIIHHNGNTYHIQGEERMPTFFTPSSNSA